MTITLKKLSFKVLNIILMIVLLVSVWIHLVTFVNIQNIERDCHKAYEVYFNDYNCYPKGQDSREVFVNVSIPGNPMIS